MDSNQHYLYVTFGRGSGGPLGTYEFLPVTIDPTTQAQSFGNWMTGATAIPTGPRYQHTIYSVTRSTTAFRSSAIFSSR